MLPALFRFLGCLGAGVDRQHPWNTSSMYSRNPAGWENETLQIPKVLGEVP